MGRIISWFVRNHVAAHVVVILVLLFGLFALKDIKKSLLPDLAFDWLTITVNYPGASPSEVEQAAVSRIESAIAATPGIDSFDSVVSESNGYIKIQLEPGTDAKAFKETIQNQIASIHGLPELVEQPKVSLVSIDMEPVSTLVIHGQASEAALKTAAEKIKQDLLDYPEITQVYINNLQVPSIHIEASELALQRYGLTFAELANAINRQSLSVPAGVIQTHNSTVAIKTAGEVQTGSGFENIVVRALPDGSRVRLGDVAKITDGILNEQRSADFNGDPAVYVSVFRSGKQDLLRISELVQDYVQHPKTLLPAGLKLDITQDVSYYYRSRMKLLLGNGLSGLFWVFIPLLFFLRWRLSFWVTSDIPFSFLGTVWVLYLLGCSFDMVSLFAFIMVLGIIGDDAIVVGENIFMHQRNGKPGAVGAILGASEVAEPVIFSSLCTMIMFIPLLFLPGAEGKLIRVIPIVIISVLVFSLFEALFILPAHLSSIVKDRPSVVGRIATIVSNGVDHMIERFYRPLVELALHWRYAVTSFFLMLFLVCIALLSSGWIKTNLSPAIEADTTTANVIFPLGTKVEVMRAAVKRLELAARQVKIDLRKETGKEQIQNIISNYGSQFGSDGPQSGDEVGSVLLEMTPSENRTLSGEEIGKRWRNYLGVIPDAVTLEFNSSLNRPGPNIDLRLTSQNLKSLYYAATELKELLASYSGVYGVQDTFQQGRQEIHLRLKPLAEDLGIKTSEVAQQVRQAFYGVDLRSLQRGQDEIKVTLGYPDQEKQSLWYLENMQIKLLNGESVPLQTIADVSFELGPSVIFRTHQKRSVEVRAYVDEGVSHPDAVMKHIKQKFLDQLVQRYPDVHWEVAGSQAGKKKFTDNLSRNTLIALLGMFFVMAISFKSYAHSLVVMSAVPFGFVGAVLGHLFLHMDITLWSMIGMTTVFGLVVNNNVVLVDYINRRQEEGDSLFLAIRDAGALRFRPVFLTSLTTVTGLIPLMFERSIQAAFLVPMAVSLASGVLFATFISLVLVPCLYHIFADLGLFKRTTVLVASSKMI